MRKVIEFTLGILFVPILLIISALSFSLNPFRYFFLKRAKTENGIPIYIPYFSQAKYKKTSFQIQQEIKDKHDLRSTEGKRKAFEEHFIKESKEKNRKKLEELSQLKSLTSKNKGLVISIILIFAIVSISIYYFSGHKSYLFFLFMTYFSYVYFKNKFVANLFNVLIDLFQDLFNFLKDLSRERKIKLKKREIQKIADEIKDLKK